MDGFLDLDEIKSYQDSRNLFVLEACTSMFCFEAKQNHTTLNDSQCTLSTNRTASLLIIRHNRLRLMIME
jgi:hypothetical protein